VPHIDGDAKPSAEVTHLFQNRFKVGEAHGGAVALMHSVRFHQSAAHTCFVSESTR
jgi:hypothetical protein